MTRQIFKENIYRQLMEDWIKVCYNQRGIKIYYKTGEKRDGQSDSK